MLDPGQILNSHWYIMRTSLSILTECPDLPPEAMLAYCTYRTKKLPASRTSIHNSCQRRVEASNGLPCLHSSRLACALPVRCIASIGITPTSIHPHHHFDTFHSVAEPKHHTRQPQELQLHNLNDIYSSPISARIAIFSYEDPPAIAINLTKPISSSTR